MMRGQWSNYPGGALSQVDRVRSRCSPRPHGDRVGLVKAFFSSDRPIGGLLSAGHSTSLA